MLDILTSPLELTSEVTIFSGLIRLGSTFLLVLILALTYKRLHHGKENCHVMMHSMIYIGVILTGAMMVIGTNLVVAFGLLGAVSIIRFRTVVENSIDMSYLFLAIVVGISSGLGLLTHALLLTLFVGTLMLVLNKLRLGMDPPSHITYRIFIKVSKTSLTAPIIDLLKEKLGEESTLIEVGTSKKTAQVKFLKPLKNISEVYEVHRLIEEILGDDKSLVIQVLKK